MNIIAVDDELLALNHLLDCIQEAIPEASVYGFARGAEAIAFHQETPCDVAFLDIQIGSTDGLSLARQLKERKSDINIIFVTGYQDYAIQAFSLLASGYLTKPICAEDVRQQLDNLRYPMQMQESPKRVRVRCFGNFEVYLDGNQVLFEYTKSKELLAFLIDRKGAMCSNHEIMAVIFEDAQVSESYFRKLRLDLVKTLPNEIFVRQRGELGIRMDALECDYYEYLAQKQPQIPVAEYMTQYSWGENTLGALLWKNK